MLTEKVSSSESLNNPSLFSYNFLFERVFSFSTYGVLVSSLKSAAWNWIPPSLPIIMTCFRNLSATWIGCFEYVEILLLCETLSSKVFSPLLFLTIKDSRFFSTRIRTFVAEIGTKSFIATSDVSLLRLILVF